MYNLFILLKYTAKHSPNLVNLASRNTLTSTYLPTLPKGTNVPIAADFFTNHCMQDGSTCTPTENKFTGSR